MTPYSFATAHLNGGPLDGQTERVPRRSGLIPPELTAKGLGKAGPDTALPVVTYRYELVADEGPTARYRYAGSFR